MSTLGCRGVTGPKPRGFWTQVAFGPACWEWTGARFTNGYGRTWVDHKSIGAHRHAWELSHLRALPTGHLVMHRCDNKPCVRPSHLRLGTALLNMRDMVDKGRSLRGPLNHNTKLTEAQAREIRRLAATVTRAALARRYRVSEALIFAIVKGRAWGWLS